MNRGAAKEYLVNVALLSGAIIFAPGHGHVLALIGGVCAGSFVWRLMGMDART